RKSKPFVLQLRTSCRPLGLWAYRARSVGRSAKPSSDRSLPRVLTENSKSGPARARAFDTLNCFRSLKSSPVPKRGSDYRPSRTGAGSSSNDDRGLNPRTARSDGLDNVDGGPDAAFYIQLGVI